MASEQFDPASSQLRITRDRFIMAGEHPEIHLQLSTGLEIEIVPHLSFDPENECVYVFGIAPTWRVFDCSPAEFEEIRRLYFEYREPVDAFLQVCVFDQLGPIPHPVLVRLATFNLTEEERQKVQAEIDNFTFIYLIRDRSSGLTKIGKSNDPESRLKQLKKQDTMLPSENDFYFLFFFRGYAYQEKILHKHFAEKRVRGEWFNLSVEDVAKIHHENVEVNMHQ